MSTLLVAFEDFFLSRFLRSAFCWLLMDQLRVAGAAGSLLGRPLGPLMATRLPAVFRAG
jgi:hypothetical protein